MLGLCFDVCCAQDEGRLKLYRAVRPKVRLSPSSGCLTREVLFFVIMMFPCFLRYFDAGDFHVAGITRAIVTISR